MGIDFLDLCFRAEKRFGVRIDAKRLWNSILVRHPTTPQDLTAGEYFDFIDELVREQGRALPSGSWNAFRIILHEVSGTRPFSIRRESKLVADLGLE